MKFWISICVIVLMQASDFCKASKHSCGNYIEYATRRFYHRTLIDDVNKVPKNYTIIYKYFGAMYKEVAYLEIDINVESSGYVHATDGKKLIDATIYIYNALNVTATIHIYGYGLILLPTINLLRKGYETKSIAFVYRRNSDSSTAAKTFAQNAIGRRRKNDSLIHFESRNITNISRFPSRAFEYSGEEYITYVAFSFNSPTAIAMINTTFVGEQEFNAIAYDMNTEHFVANVSIYGIKSLTGRPFEFEGVI